MVPNKTPGLFGCQYNTPLPEVRRNFRKIPGSPYIIEVDVVGWWLAPPNSKPVLSNVEGYA
jgi:hypothetical protein